MAKMAIKGEEGKSGKGRGMKKRVRKKKKNRGGNNTKRKRENCKGMRRDGEEQVKEEQSIGWLWGSTKGCRSMGQ